MPNIAQLNKLIEQFGMLPGVGAKTAQKMAYFMLAQPDAKVKEFADTLLASRNLIHCCPRCQNLTDQPLCPICADAKRQGGAICVVEKPEDVEAMERTRTFHGTYHVLHGLISPVNGIGADQLRIRELLHRVAEETVEEVILATSPNVEGQATALYLFKLLKPFEVKVTGLALGIPVGGTLEYADSLTLTRAMENRRTFE
ncbi:MAG: recombination protein RecR [Clostridiales bacterium]|nr:MAG: recombination protein RecR [Clostridiales bacterium]